MSNIKSPITYSGSKYKLLDFIKMNLPQDRNIKTFIDAFGGSGVVSLNMKYINIEKVIYNELNQDVFEMLENLGKGNMQYIEECINEAWEKRRIKTMRTQEQYYKMSQEEKKESTGVFYNFRKYINTYGNKLRETDPLKYWSYIMVYSKAEIFGRIVFKDGKLTGSCGVRPTIEKILEDIKMFQYNWKRIETKNTSYNWIKNIKSDNNVFIYLDPPYYNTQAEYNKFWKKEQEEELLTILKDLDKKGIKWMMSNAPNEHLYKFAEKYNFEITEKEYYYSLGGGSKKSIEIIMTNYKLQKQPKQLELFI